MRDQLFHSLIALVLILEAVSILGGCRGGGCADGSCGSGPIPRESYSPSASTSATPHRGAGFLNGSGTR
jgi:hypothetical protein